MKKILIILFALIPIIGLAQNIRSEQIKDFGADVAATSQVNTNTIKLATIQAGAEVNVQSDLTETNTGADGYVIGRDSLLFDQDTVDILGTKADLLNYYTKTQSDSKYPIDSIWTQNDKTYYRQGGVLDSVLNLDPVLSIGDFYQGGLIFYIAPDGKSGLVVTNTKLGDAPWSLTNTTTGATGQVIGTGLQNTTAIVADQGDGSYAAKLCLDLQAFGYSDWHLPSIDELELIYDTIYSDGFGSYTTDKYFASTESSSSAAYSLRFLDGNISSIESKTGSEAYVAVRSFSVDPANTLPDGVDGDIIINVNGDWESLNIGSEGQVLKVTSGAPAWGSSSGVGTLTNFTSGNLSPLFTTSVANSTSTPALSFSLSNAPATYRVYASSGTTTPAFVALTDSHIPNTITVSNYMPLAGGTMTGKLTGRTSSTGSASIRMPHGVAPTSPANGDLWTTTSGVFARVNGVTVDLSSAGGGGVNSVTFPSTGGLYNSGTSADVNGILDFSNLNDEVMSLGDYVAFTDISSGTSPLAVRRETVSDLKTLLSPTVRESDLSPSYSNIETIEFFGATVSNPSTGVARITINSGTGFSVNGEILFNNIGVIDGFGTVGADNILFEDKSLEVDGQGSNSDFIGNSIISYGWAGSGGNNQRSFNQSYTYQSTGSTGAGIPMITTNNGENKIAWATVTISIYNETDDDFQRIIYNTYIKKTGTSSFTDATYSEVSRIGDASMNTTGLTSISVSNDNVFYGVGNLDAADNYQITIHITGTLLDN